jgi:quercetin dioxygenase-like cupin family protein
MTVHPIGEFHPIPNRPGTRGRKLIAAEHGVTSFFVDEFVMDEGASVPLHTHPIEEALE